MSKASWKHGERVHKLQWTKQLKISIIENDETSIEKLIQDLPQFETIEEMKEAAYMMQEAHDFLSAKKDELASNLVKIKKQKEFLNSTITKTSSFDQSH